MSMDGAPNQIGQHSEASDYGPQLIPPADSAAPSSEEEGGETRLNVRLAPKVAKALAWMATVMGVSRVDAIRHAIGTARFFLEVREKGGTVYVKMPADKNYQQVVFAD